MVNEKRLDLIDREKVYENACAGCTRHGENPGECYHDEPCERLIFAFTVAEPVDAVEVVHGQMIERIVDHECPWHTVWECSLCGCSGRKWYNYCPNCGAKMDREES